MHSKLWVQAYLHLRNGWYDPLIQYQAYYNFTVSPGNTYDYSPYNESVQAQLYNNLYGKGNCIDQVRDCYDRGLNEICAAADSFCANTVESIYDDYLGRDEYDVREYGYLSSSSISTPSMIILNPKKC